MRSIVILRGNWGCAGRRITRCVLKNVTTIKEMGEKLVVSREPPLPFTSPTRYPLSSVLHYRLEPEKDKSEGRSSSRMSGYDTYLSLGL